ncbi:MAG TPA: hypothetical protein VK678_01645, partial [Bradyrhizobium sp.]|nr:hypothetical protein [Bradyrhizobium sp.]
NTIIYTNPQPTAKRPSAIKFGVATSSGKYGNIVFDQLTIAGNKIYVAPGVATTAASSYIYFNHAPAAGFKFDNTTITNNTLFADGSKPILAVRDSAKGVNWRETNNVETAYQAPPPIPTAQERSRK